MKVCLACNARFDCVGWECPACHAVPATIAGVRAFSPGLAEANAGFKPSYFAELANVEAGNFWFRSRNRLILWALGRYFRDASNFFEIGCGTGFVLSAIEREFSALSLFGSEVYGAGLVYAKERLRRCTLFQMDARRMPFEAEFDVIGAFDVLEHIEEDETVLGQMHRATSTNGGIILTVPQHAFLWSEADSASCHVRRYSASALKGKVTQAGFTVVETTSFVSLLLPLMIASRIAAARLGMEYDGMAELRIGGLANAILERTLDFERMLIRFGVRFPFGGSLLLIARK